MTDVVFLTPTPHRPCQEYLQAMDASLDVLDAAGIDMAFKVEIGSVYISWARATLLRTAMRETDAKAFVFIDHDISWTPQALLKLVRQGDDVVAGDYRYKHEPEEYMGKLLTDPSGRPMVRADGTLEGGAVPAGFLKVTRTAIETFRAAYPSLIFGPENEYIDLFNHGAYEGLWWGEDYAFSRRWRDCGGEIVVIPDLDLTHHGDGGRAYPGNLHRFLLRQPGGSEAEAA